MSEESLQSAAQSAAKRDHQGVPKYKMPLAVIIGMPAAGKTRGGKELAHILNVPFMDTDDLIEQKINMPISQYFKDFGEESFRDIEAQIVKDAIFADSEQSAPIIALGGGSPMRPQTARSLKKIYKTRWPRCLLASGSKRCN